MDTTVPELEQLREWLQEEDITHVVMESTGSYWIPIFNLLEGHFTVVLANPEEVKNRKGHKRIARTLSIWRIYYVTTTFDPVTFRLNQFVSCVI